MSIAAPNSPQPNSSSRQARRAKNPIWITISVSLFIANGSIARAQIEPDTSLGSESSEVIRDVEIRGRPGDRLEGGARRGSNLFHSFREFGVLEGRAAYFSNPDGIDNIFSRVTGSNPSAIAGTLGVLGEANLFLLNPNGILFGAGAQLDLRGAFVASTGSAFDFPDGSQFSAIAPQSVPILDVAVVPPVGIELAGAGTIFVRGSELAVEPGGTLALIGGDIEQTGGRLLAPGGRIALVSLTDGRVQLAADFVPDLEIGDRGAISLLDGALASVVADGGGEIAIAAGDLLLDGGSRLEAGISVGAGGSGTAGEISIRSTESVRLDNSSQIANSVSSGAIGNGGNIHIDTAIAILNNGSKIATSTSGDGNAGQVQILASDRVELSGNSQEGSGSGLSSEVLHSQARGNAAGIEIVTGHLTLADGAFVSATTSGKGDAGSVRVTASETVELQGQSNAGFVSGIFSNVSGEAIGDSGGVQVDAESLFLRDGARIEATTFGEGDAALVAIAARDTVSLQGNSSFGSGSGIASEVGRAEAIGNAGGVRIETGRLALADGAFISATTSGNGDAVPVAIAAREAVDLRGESGAGFASGIFSNVGSQARGEAGGVQIEADSLTLDAGARIEASTFGEGDAALVSIVTEEAVSLQGNSSFGSGSGIASEVASPEARGNAGGVSIEAANLTLADGAFISATTLGNGDAASVEVSVREAVEVRGESAAGFASGIFSNVAASGVGDAGGIEISAATLTLSDGAQLDASTFGAGDAAVVDIRVRESAILRGNSRSGNGSGIGSQVGGDAIAPANAGGVKIETGVLVLADGAFLTASTFREGNAALVDIQAREAIALSGESAAGFASGIFSTVDDNARGDAGGIRIETGMLTLTSGARIDASTFGAGDSALVEISARERVDVRGRSRSGVPSQIASRVEPGASGKAAGVRIDAPLLSLADGGRVSATTSGFGPAGNVAIAASQVEMSDGARVETSTSSSFDAGDIIFTTSDRLDLESGASIDVSALATGNAGDIEISAREVELTASAIGAVTASRDGGNIEISVADTLWLRSGSSISTTAGRDGAGGNGGKIAIAGRFLLAPAFENSDITANAFEGNGGSVTVSADAVLGIAPRDRATALSDITASSEFGRQGAIAIQTPETDATRGLILLPQTEVDAEFARACELGEDALAFSNLGKGGQSPTPETEYRGGFVLEWLDSLEDIATTNSEVRERETRPVARGCFVFSSP